MRADVKKEQIQRDMKLVLEAVIETEKQRNDRITSVDRAPLGVNLYQIQVELYNEDNGIDLTDLPDTIVRDRLIRLEVDSKLSSERFEVINLHDNRCCSFVIASLIQPFNRVPEVV